MRNQWGEYWGEKGWFRVERGVNALGIEDYCYWATPDAWGFHNTDDTTDGTQDLVHYDESKVMSFHRVARGLESTSKAPAAAAATLVAEEDVSVAPSSSALNNFSVLNGAAFVAVAFLAFFVGRNQGHSSARSEENIPLTSS